MDILDEIMIYRRVTFYGIFNGLKLKGLPVTPSLQWQEIGWEGGIQTPQPIDLGWSKTLGQVQWFGYGSIPIALW